MIFVKLLQYNNKSCCFIFIKSNVLRKYQDLFNLRSNRSGLLQKIKIAALGIIFPLSAILSGCGGDTTSNSAAPTVTIAAVTPPPPPATPISGIVDFTTIDVNRLDNYANPVLPAYYDASVAALDNTPNNNPINDRVATLGRVLFYDKRLSVNDTTACASCHQQANGFDDPNRFSTGFSGTAFTSAHAMRLGNIRYYRPGTMFWDKRAASLELQVSQPIIHPIEMGFDATHGGINALLTKLAASTYYPDLFTLAFGNSAITEARIQQAIAQFTRSMISAASRWDTAYAQVFNAAAPNRNLNVALPGFSASEELGHQLFMTGPGQGGAGCAACHQPPTFGLAANSLSNGLDANETKIFKSPALKNVGLSRAFMHDGRFSTLEQVIEHYNSGIQNGPALDNRLKTPGGAPLRLNLTQNEKAALVAFLLTLNDNNLTTDAKFSNPFKK
jgi:cytochrome c peroxidase